MRVPRPCWGGRWLRLTLAAFWTLDALLQLQPANFGKQLVFGTILGNAENQPQPIYGSLVLASHLLGPYAFELNIAIIAVQLSIAAGLLWRRTAKPALGLSIMWALGIWWLGEGFGGLFAGKATLLVGAPGPALLYALLALVAWPGTRREPGAVAAARREPGTTAAGGGLGEPLTRDIWTLLWIGGAILRVVPFWFPPVYALAGDLQLDLNQEPSWLFQLNQRLSHLASTAGLALVIALAFVEAAIGLGVLTRHRRASLAAGIVVATIYWTIGQQFAQLFTGGATDIAAGPLYVVLALTLWPRKMRPGHPATTCSMSNSGAGRDSTRTGRRPTPPWTGRGVGAVDLPADVLKKDGELFPLVAVEQRVCRPALILRSSVVGPDLVAHSARTYSPDFQLSSVRSRSCLLPVCEPCPELSSSDMR